jgi:hypothetical protein
MENFRVKRISIKKRHYNRNESEKQEESEKVTNVVLFGKQGKNKVWEKKTSSSNADKRLRL